MLAVEEIGSRLNFHNLEYLPKIFVKYGNIIYDCKVSYMSFFTEDDNTFVSISSYGNNYSLEFTVNIDTKEVTYTNFYHY